MLFILHSLSGIFLVLQTHCISSLRKSLHYRKQHCHLYKLSLVLLISPFSWEFLLIELHKTADGIIIANALNVPMAMIGPATLG